MAKKKYYVVKVGKVPGIYFDWDSCKTQVNGYKGAVYKGFESLNEAQKYLEDTDNSYESKSHISKKQGLSEKKNRDNKNIEKREDSLYLINDEKHFTAYVDGSYNDAEKLVGCGVVLFADGNVIKESFAVSGDDLISMRNVAGEINAAKRAMEYAVKKNAESLDIYHDYEGIAKWCTGEWKANLTETIKYRDYYRSIEGIIRITFHKVKGHSGDKYNNMADELAKMACNN